jgi:hypothetical protein
VAKLPALALSLVSTTKGLSTVGAWAAALVSRKPKIRAGTDTTSTTKRVVELATIAVIDFLETNVREKERLFLMTPPHAYNTRFSIVKSMRICQWSSKRTAPSEVALVAGPLVSLASGSDIGTSDAWQIIFEASWYLGMTRAESHQE